jgi:Fe-S-cluster containining protein
MSAPWFRDGLKFACTGCGDCCTGAPGFVWVNKTEIEALAKEVGVDVPEFERRYVRKVGIRKSLIEWGNGDCVFFDGKSRKCQVYNARPRQCRTWPFWPSNLASPDTWADAAERCRGCNRGKMVPLEKIQTQLGEVRV